MKYLNLIALLFLMAGFAKAETIVCDSVGKGDIKEVIAKRNPHDYEPQWFDVVVKQKGFFAKDLRFSLTPLYLPGDKMMLMEFEGSPDKTKLLMTFDEVSKLSKRDRKVEFVSNKGSAKEQKQVLSCRSDRPIKFVDYCSSSKYGTPSETLLYASKVRNSNLVDMVIGCNPNVNELDKNGCSPLMYAVDHLCGTGERDDFRDFAHNKRIVDALISAGAFVDIADPITLATPLIKSAQDRDAYAVKSFADMEADIDAQDKDGFTALMSAADRGDEKLVELILGYSPNLELANSSGQTAMTIARSKGFSNIELLLQTPDKILSFAGESSGGCSLNDNSIEANKVVLVELKASDKKMFLLEIPGLGVKLMADPGKAQSIRLKPTKTGSYKYSCGVHGSNNASKGIISVR